MPHEQLWGPCLVCRSKRPLLGQEFPVISPAEPASIWKKGSEQKSLPIMLHKHFWRHHGRNYWVMNGICWPDCILWLTLEEADSFKLKWTFLLASVYVQGSLSAITWVLEDMGSYMYAREGRMDQLQSRQLPCVRVILPSSSLCSSFPFIYFNFHSLPF